jgi:GH15 family glucan-1,4-alpha-glucosidase
MTHPVLQPVYNVYGEHRLTEQTLDYLDGFNGAKPVRIGNAAASQLQLDLYGEVLDAVYQFVRRGGALDRMTRRLLVGLGKAVVAEWEAPDQGIWETRSAPRQHTFSKAMCWIALDRLLRLEREVGLKLPADLATTRDEIGTVLKRDGFNPQLNSYVLELGGSEVDASLLRLGRHGFIEPDSPEARATFERVIERLDRNGLVYRYLTDDGLPRGEGAFVMCSFWAVTAQNAAGDHVGAVERFERLLGYANDLGLYAEEIDPVTKAHLGNFPQAFSHVGLIDAALALSEREQMEEGVLPLTGNRAVAR